VVHAARVVGLVGRQRLAARDGGHALQRSHARTRQQPVVW
jgi:hypothetical protein